MPLQIATFKVRPRERGQAELEPIIMQRSSRSHRRARDLNAVTRTARSEADLLNLLSNSLKFTHHAA